MARSKRKNTTLYQPPLPPHWTGRDSLELVYQLNERALTLMSEAVRENSGPWPQAPQARLLWSGLGAEALKRAARLPFVILEACLTDEEGWQSMARDPERSIRAPPGIAIWPPRVREELFGELLVFAWHTVKRDRRVARLSLGVLPGVAEVLATLTPRQLAVISARHASVLRLRWQDGPEFWTRLLVAARDGDEEALSEIQLHAKLLLSGSLVASLRPSKG